MATRETRLPTASALVAEDKIRIVQNDTSRNISYLDFLQPIIIATQLASPFSFFNVGGNFAIEFDSASYLLVDTSVSPITITLPLAASIVSDGNVSKVYTVKKATNAANDVTIITSNGETVDNNTSIILSGPSYPVVTVISDGVAWWIVAA